MLGDLYLERLARHAAGELPGHLQNFRACHLALVGRAAERVGLVPSLLRALAELGTPRTRLAPARLLIGRRQRHREPMRPCRRVARLVSLVGRRCRLLGGKAVLRSEPRDVEDRLHRLEVIGGDPAPTPTSALPAPLHAAVMAISCLGEAERVCDGD